MRIKLKECVWIVTAALCIGLSGGPVRAATPTPQEQQDQDYSKNKNYQLGMRDGRDDAAHNRDHSRKRKFKKDDDQKAYEAGYQAAHRNNSQDHK